MRIIPIILLAVILVSSSFITLISNEGLLDPPFSVSTSEVIPPDPAEPAFDGTRATRYVDDSGGQAYKTIQSAVDVSNPGDTIFVYPGTYTEKVTVNKALTVTGSGAQNTLIAGQENGDVVKITANGVDMSGFTVTGTGPNPGAGSILLDGVTGCRVENNSCTPASYPQDGDFFTDNFEDGTLAPWTKSGYGGVGTHTSNSGSRSMYLYYDTTYMDSPIIDLSNAISASLSCWVRRGHDSFSEEPDEGENLLIQYRNQGLTYTTLQTLLGSGTAGQIYQLNFNLPGSAFHTNFRIRFYLTDGSRGSFDYWHVDDVKVTGTFNQLSTPVAGIILDTSHNNIVRNNNCSSTNGEGMKITDSNDNSIDNNTFENNLHGIYVSNSDRNTFGDNQCNSNDVYGLYLTQSNDNVMRRNNCSDNEQGIYLSNSDRTVISENVCDWNDFHGLRLVQSDDGLLTDNNCSYNEFGIDILNSDRNVVSGSVYSSNDIGIDMETSDNNNILNNSCHSNLEKGINVKTSANNDILGNICPGNVHGLYMDNGNTNTIAHNDLTDNQYGLVLDNTDHCTIKNNNCSISDQGIRLISSANNHVANNTCPDAINGIFLEGSNSNTIRENICPGNEYGLRLESSAMNDILNNSFGRSVVDSIYLYQSENNTIKRNNCSDNSNSGITAIDSISDSIIDNIYDGNAEHGVNLSSVDNLDLRENLCRSNGGTGIFGKVIQRSTISNNAASGNANHGISLNGSDLNEITLNLLNNNGRTGLDLHGDCDDNTISYNSISGNGKLGISLLSGDYENRRNDRAELSDNNSFHHNDFVENNKGGAQAHDGGENNTWDDDQGEGNFWYDYRWQNPSASNNGLIWNMSYVVNATSNATDRYPLVYAGPGIDLIPPEMVVDNTPFEATTGDQFTFSAEFEDNLGVIIARVLYSYDNSIFTNLSMILVGESGRECAVMVEPNATVIYYRFFVKDVGRNWIFTENATADVLDNDAPKLEEDLTGDLATTGDPFTIMMNASDNIGIDPERVYCRYTFNEIEYFYGQMALDNLTFNMTVDIPADALFVKYSFNISDTSGNWFSIDLPRVYVDDNDPPVLVADESQEADATTGEDFNISASFSDNIKVLSAYVRYSFMGGVEANDTMVLGNGKIWSKIITVPPNATSFNYSFHVLDAVENRLNTVLLFRPVTDNDPPVPQAGPDMEIEQGDTVSFNASKSTDNIGILEYYWTFDYEDVDQKLSGSLANFTFTITGNYTVTLTVLDAAGNIETVTFNITVLAVEGGDDDDSDDDDDTGDDDDDTGDDDTGDDDDDADDDDTGDDDDDTGDDDNTTGNGDEGDSTLISSLALPVIAGLVAFLVILALIVLFIVMRRRGSKKDDEEIEDEESADASSHGESLHDSGGPAVSIIPDSGEPDKYPCLDCGAELRFVDEYEQWWCDSCMKYSGESASGKPVEGNMGRVPPPTYVQGIGRPGLPPPAPIVSLPSSTEVSSGRHSYVPHRDRLALPAAPDLPPPDRAPGTLPIPVKPMAELPSASTVAPQLPMVGTASVGSGVPTIPTTRTGEIPVVRTTSIESGFPTIPMTRTGEIPVVRTTPVESVVPTIPISQRGEAPVGGPPVPTTRIDPPGTAPNPPFPEDENSKPFSADTLLDLPPPE